MKSKTLRSKKLNIGWMNNELYNKIFEMIENITYTVAFFVVIYLAFGWEFIVVSIGASILFPIIMCLRFYYLIYNT